LRCLCGCQELRWTKKTRIAVTMALFAVLATIRIIKEARFQYHVRKKENIAAKSAAGGAAGTITVPAAYIVALVVLAVLVLVVLVLLPQLKRDRCPFHVSVHKFEKPSDVRPGVLKLHKQALRMSPKAAYVGA